MKLFGVEITCDFRPPPTEADDDEVTAAFQALGGNMDESPEFPRYAGLVEKWHSRGYTAVVSGRDGRLMLMDDETLDKWAGEE